MVAQPYPGNTGAIAAGATVNVPLTSTGNSISIGSTTNAIVNPTRVPQCTAGLNVALVLDRSGSIDASERPQYASAVRGLVATLAQVGGVDVTSIMFNSDAAVSAPNSGLATNALATTLYNTLTGTAGWANATNWDRALQVAAQQSADVVLMITDGAPTVYGTGNTAGNVTVRNIEHAILSANSVKHGGVPVLGVGVALPGGSVPNLQAISGTTANQDYFTSSWDELEKQLSDIAKGLTCQVPVEVSKTTVTEDGTTTTNAGGWEFGAAHAGTGTALQGATPQTTTAGANGTAKWDITFTQPSGQAASLTLTETLQAGWTLTSARCSIGTGGMTALPITGGNSVTITGLEATSGKVTCVFRNTKTPQDGSATWNKVDGETGDLLGGSTWQLDGPGGYSEEVVDNTGGIYLGLDADPAAGQFRVDDLPAGEYTLTEIEAPEGYELLEGTHTVTVVAGEKAPTPIQIENTQIAGIVTWGKVTSGSDDTPLGGSSWRITGPGLGPDGIVVADFEGTPPNAAGRDQDGAAGRFFVDDLAWGDYTVTEEIAPAGYQLSDPPASFTFTISASNLRHDEGDISNDQVNAIMLPIAGGSGTLPYLAGGLGILLAALAAWLVFEQRRRRQASTDEVMDA